MMEYLREIYNMIKDNTQSVIMTALMVGACVIYGDFKEYIHEATVYDRQQSEKQQELNRQFIEALNNINNRLDVIERTIITKNKEHESNS